MADNTYRANLSSSSIPVDPVKFGRSVIIKDRDNNYAPNLAAKLDKDKDIGLPQVLYVANALPTEFGYRSVGFFGSKETCPATPYLSFPIRSTTETATLIHTVEGHLYRLKKASEPASVPQFVYVATVVGNMSYAHVAGTTYIYVAGVGCYTYSFSTGTLSSVTLGGLTASEVLGVTATGGYLLAWSRDAIAWSSLIDATDFVPSLDTGAGGGSVEGAKGAITVCTSNSYGIYIFTEVNCISAQLSNNARYPFNFREIVGSSGLSSIQSVSYEGNQNSAYAFTSAGFQQVSHNGSKNVWTDLYENALNTPVWSEATVIPKTPTAGTNGKVEEAKIVTIGTRFVCVSVKDSSATFYTQCWVYDLALDRWGRIVKDHLEVFETENSLIGFITADKRFLTVDSPFATGYAERVEADMPYIAMGRYQWSRARLTILQGIEIENLYPADLYDEFGNQYGEDVYPSVYVLSALDGKSGSFATTYRSTEISDAFATYLYHTTAVNHVILVKGHFDLNSLVLTMSNGGSS